MYSSENIEKVRQEIMRFRELLNIMQLKVQAGERAYDKIMAICPPQDGLKEKDRQKQVAEVIIDDLSALKIAVSQASFDAREMHKAFDELYNIILATPDPELE